MLYSPASTHTKSSNDGGLLGHRRHLMELHEQPWFPEQWRQMFQGGLGRAQSLIGAFDHAAPLISQLLERLDADEVLDLCSGSAEVVVTLREKIEGEPRFVVSDLFPDFDRYALLRETHEGFDFYPDPVDALEPPSGAPRVRSMISTLHHFRRHEVQSILADAAENADGIFILESTDRTWNHLVQTLPMPLPAAAICAFGLRPWRPQHVLWSLLLPVVPLVALIDSVVSVLRSHTLRELREITASIGCDDFAWEVGSVKMAKAPLTSTYVLGWRRSRAAAVAAGRA